MHSTWQSQLTELGMRIVERDGAARSVSSTAPDAALLDLSHFGVLAFEGADAKSFLQGYLTCDMDLLTPEHALLGALCNLQGRTVADMVVVEHRARVLLWMHSSVMPTFQDALRKYLMFSKSKMHVLDEWISVGNLTPLQANAPVLGCVEDGEGVAVRMPGATPRWLHLLPLPQALERARTVGITDGSTWDAIDVEGGWVHLTHASSGQFLPQMLGYSELGAVNFGKGCYLGQEIVARAEHRGAVKRHLASASWHGATVPNVGDHVLDDSARRIATVVAASGATPAGVLLMVTTQSFEQVGRTAAGVTIEIR